MTESDLLTALLTGRIPRSLCPSPREGDGWAVFRHPTEPDTIVHKRWNQTYDEVRAHRFAQHMSGCDDE